MIEIVLLKSNKVVGRARAKTPESAIAKARTLWDENRRGYQGDQKSMAVYFLVNGQLSRMIEGRRP